MVPKDLVVPVDQEQGLRSPAAISRSVPPDLPDRINKGPADLDKAGLRALPECRVDPAAQVDPEAPAWADPVGAAGLRPIRAVSSARCVTPWIIPALKDGSWSR